MKFLRWLPIAVAALGITSAASATEFSSFDEFNERDFESVINFIKCKRGIPLQEKACDLMISGDIRFEWENYKEKKNGIRMRGKNAPKELGFFGGSRIPTNQFDVEFNLMFDYRSSCTWAVAHLEFDNNAGIDIDQRGCYGYRTPYPESKCSEDPVILDGNPKWGCHGSGTCDRLALRKAFFGWNVFEQCNSRLDIEVGRRHLYDVFDSRVMFRSRFDGVLLRYSNCFECVGDFYTNLGAFVIDENSNHWGWVLEAGLLDIADCGFDFKYALIHWNKNGENRCWKSDTLQYTVSQFYLAYNFNPELLCSRAKLYAAFLVNHDADDLVYSYDCDNYYRGDKENFGWYIGFLVGDVCKEGDWAVDVNYQYVEAQVFPECDLTGIGLGNVRNVPFRLNPGFGWLNYHGVRAEMLYALTDNLSLHPSWEYSTNIEDFPATGITGYNSGNTSGGRPTDSTYSKFELEVIYAF